MIAAELLPKYCRYGGKHYIINRSINQLTNSVKDGHYSFLFYPPKYNIFNTDFNIMVVLNKIPNKIQIYLTYFHFFKKSNRNKIHVLSY